MTDQTPDTGDILQLRILTGMHAGARAPLGDAELVVGSEEGCDIVLADEGLLPRHARLAREAGGWWLHWLPQEPGALPPAAPLPLQRGVSVAVGPVIVALDGADAPWPTLEQLVLARYSGAFVPPPALPEAMEPEEEGVQAAGPSGAPPAGRRGRWMSVTLAVAAGLAAIAVPLGFMAWTSPQAASQAQAQAPANRTAPDPAVAAQRQAIERIIESLGLAGQAGVEASGGGWLVRASYVDDLSAEKLLAALSRLSPRPALRLTSEQDLPQDVTDALARLLPGSTGAVKAVHEGGGRVRLEGRMASVEERDRLLAALREALPQVRHWEAKVLVREDASELLLAELRGGGFDDLSGYWDGGTFVMNVRLQQAQVPQWERTLAQALTRHNLPMRAVLSFASAGDAGTARLPFQVRSVVGGDAPYVVLAGGGRLQPDGSHMGWRLRAVEAQRVVFDNGNQRAVIPR